MRAPLFASLILMAQFSMAQIDRKGNGGDAVGIEFNTSFLQAIRNIQKYRILGLEQIAEIDFEERLPNFRVVVVDTPLIVGIEENTQECVAINYPLQQLVKLNRSKWLSINSNLIKEGLALHEILGLLGLESSGDYRYSSKYLAYFALDPSGVREKYPVHTADLLISQIPNRDNVNASLIYDLREAHVKDFAVTARLVTAFVGGAAGYSRIILTLLDDRDTLSDFSPSVSFEILAVDKEPTSVSLVRISKNTFRLTFKVVAVLPLDENYEYKTKKKMVEALITLGPDKSITSVKFRE